VYPKVYLYACRRRCLIAAFGAVVHDHYDNRSLPRQDADGPNVGAAKSAGERVPVSEEASVAAGRAGGRGYREGTRSCLIALETLIHVRVYVQYPQTCLVNTDPVYLVKG
jgi:hypothetical protein